MNTEITDVTNLKGVLFYDADCPFCVRLAGRVRPGLAGRGFQLLPLQTPGYREQLGLTEAELLAEMWLLLPNPRIHALPPTKAEGRLSTLVPSPDAALGDGAGAARPALPALGQIRGQWQDAPLPNGQKYGGADALLEISRHFWWTWPVRQLARLRIVKRWLRGGYGWVARHRHCADGVCKVKKGRRL